jgi:hypothetical protein
VFVDRLLGTPRVNKHEALIIVPSNVSTNTRHSQCLSTIQQARDTHNSTYQRFSKHEALIVPSSKCAAQSYIGKPIQSRPLCMVCPTSFGHCMVCPTSFGHCMVCPTSFGHCMVCPTSIYGFWLPIEHPTQKTNDSETWTSLKPVMNSCTPEESSFCSTGHTRRVTV